MAKEKNIYIDLCIVKTRQELFLVGVSETFLKICFIFINGHVSRSVPSFYIDMRETLTLNVVVVPYGSRLYTTSRSSVFLNFQLVLLTLKAIPIARIHTN